MNEYDRKLEVITERTSGAMYAFWSAMLTAHTVILSVAVTLPSINHATDLWQPKLVGALATLCIFLLLFNFAAVRVQYETIGQRLINYDVKLSDTQRKKDILLAERRHCLMRVAEKLAILGLIVEAICLLFLVFFR